MDKAEAIKYSADAATSSGSESWIIASKPRTAGLQYITTADGTMLYYKDWGRGKPIVFVHSWAMSSDMWQYQMAPLVKAGFRCIAYDRRGHGRSTQPAHDTITTRSQMISRF